MSTYRSRTDQRVADDVGTEKRLMCTAHGCPNLWSTDVGHLCRWHADAPPHRWPEVTQDMQDFITDKAQRNGFDKPSQHAFTNTEKSSILNRLRAIFAGPKDHRAWIGRLREKQAAGIPLTAMQKHCLAQVREWSGKL